MACIQETLKKKSNFRSDSSFRLQHHTKAKLSNLTTSAYDHGFLSSHARSEARPAVPPSSKSPERMPEVATGTEPSAAGGVAPGGRQGIAVVTGEDPSAASVAG